MKAAFFDIDGTVLDSQNFIPESTVEGIRKLQEKGITHFYAREGAGRLSVIRRF